MRDCPLEASWIEPKGAHRLMRVRYRALMQKHWRSVASLFVISGILIIPVAWILYTYYELSGLYLAVGAFLGCWLFLVMASHILYII